MPTPSLRSVLFAALAAGLLLASAAPAAACSFEGHEPHQTDPAEEAVDVEAPSPPTSADAGITIKRGLGTRPGGMSTSCDDLGWIEFELAHGGDDRTPDDQLGYRLALVDGELPDDLALPAEAIRLLDDDTIFLLWIDEAVNGQEPFEFSIDVFAVDLAGNESDDALRIDLSDPGTNAAGCSAAGAPPVRPTALLLGLLLLLAVGRR